MSANLVPADAIDTFRTHVSDDIWNLCEGRVRVTLTAAPGTSDQVQLLWNGKVIASAVSVTGQPATASASEPSCFAGDSGWLSVVVSSVSGPERERLPADPERFLVSPFRR